jgi:hypothetical protein
MGEGGDDVDTYFYGCCSLAGGFEIGGHVCGGGGCWVGRGGLAGGSRGEGLELWGETWCFGLGRMGRGTVICGCERCL